jgi:hypothetical protein
VEQVVWPWSLGQQSNESTLVLDVRKHQEEHMWGLEGSQETLDIQGTTADKKNTNFLLPY